MRIAADLSESLSVVLKRESAQSVERALRFHRAVGSRVPDAVPACLGGVVDKERDVGLLALEDVAPAEQGDVLSGCDAVQAQAAVHALARVHAASWAYAEKQASGDVERWRARPMEPEAWAERLAGAAARFPSILNDSVARRLVDLPRHVGVAITSLRHGRACWIHCDAHLDNVLFRSDGTAVLLDWSGAVIGPPALDLARLLTEGIDAGRSKDKARLLVAEYLAELAARGAMGAIDDVWARLSDGVALLAQGAVGWAARDEEREPRQRMRALQQNLLRSVCAWATNPEMAARGRVFGPSAQP